MVIKPFFKKFMVLFNFSAKVITIFLVSKRKKKSIGNDTPLVKKYIFLIYILIILFAKIFLKLKKKLQQKFQSKKWKNGSFFYQIDPF